jgi:hypothetical protein
MGLVWAGADAAEIDEAHRDLLAIQKPGGGWPELPFYPPVAYSTVEALYALHEAATPATDRCLATRMEIFDRDAGRRWNLARPYPNAFPRRRQPKILHDRISVWQGRISLLCGKLLGHDGAASGPS